MKLESYLRQDKVLLDLKAENKEDFRKYLISANFISDIIEFFKKGE
jgi:pyruvate-formate lyase-activating enzyme